MSKVIEIQDMESLQSHIDSNEQVVIDFHAKAWCQPCIRFAPHYERAAEEADEVTFLAVDVDTVPEVMVAYGISSVPTVKLYKHGEYARDIKAPQGALPFLRDLRS